MDIYTSFMEDLFASIDTAYVNGFLDVLSGDFEESEKCDTSFTCPCRSKPGTEKRRLRRKATFVKANHMKNVCEDSRPVGYFKKNRPYNEEKRYRAYERSQFKNQEEKATRREGMDENSIFLSKQDDDLAKQADAIIKEVVNCNRNLCTLEEESNFFDRLYSELYQQYRELADRMQEVTEHLKKVKYSAERSQDLILQTQKRIDDLLKAAKENPYIEEF